MLTAIQIQTASFIIFNDEPGRRRSLFEKMMILELAMNFFSPRKLTLFNGEQYGTNNALALDMAPADGDGNQTFFEPMERATKHIKIGGDNKTRFQTLM